MSFLATFTPRPTLPPLIVGDRSMEFGRGVLIMGVLNTTPDSFSDGGQFLDPSAAIEYGQALWEAGAHILDVGGESTRPGADPVPLKEELKRVLPVIEGLRKHTDAWISIDTYKSAVAAAAIDAGADIINDISGLGFDKEMAPLAAETKRGLILMHIRKTPRTMQRDISYQDLIGDISTFLKERIKRATTAGVDPSRIIIDPGIGFGKTHAQDYQLLRELSAFADLGHPILSGPSRKSFLGAATGRPPQERVWATAAAVTASILAGANLVRVHDVQQMVDVVHVAQAICAIEADDHD